MSVSAAGLELDSTPSVHPCGGGERNWASESYLNDSATATELS